MPLTVSTGPGVLTGCSAVTAGPALARASTAAGTVVTWRTTPAGAADSLAGRAGVAEVSLTATSVATSATTTATLLPAIRNLLRVSARRAAACWAAIFCLAFRVLVRSALLIVPDHPSGAGLTTARAPSTTYVRR